MSRMSKPLCNAFSSGDHPVLLAAALVLPLLLQVVRGQGQAPVRRGNLHRIEIPSRYEILRGGIGMAISTEIY